MSGGTVINGVVLDEALSRRLKALQESRAEELAKLLEDGIGFLLENSLAFDGKAGSLLDILWTLHSVRTELLGLVPGWKGGEQ